MIKKLIRLYNLIKAAGSVDNLDYRAFYCFDYYKQRINDLENFIRKSKCSTTCECEKCRDIVRILQERL